MSIPVLIIPVLNRFDLLEQCIQSIDYPIDNLLIIDNSNSYILPDGLYAGSVQVLNMPANMGAAGSWNLGIKCFPHSPYWVIGSNDTHWNSGALLKMEESSSENRLVLSTEGWNTFSVGSEVVKRVGLFDENYHPAYYEDGDYAERMKKLGVQDWLVGSEVDVNCLGASTTLHSNQKFEELNKVTNESNYQYFSRKNSSDNEFSLEYQYQLQRRIDNEWLKD